MATVILKTGRERSLLRRHPWIFTGALGKVEGDPKAGDTVLVTAADGTTLGRGAWSPDSQIAVRMWTFDAATEVDAALLTARLRASIAARAGLHTGPTSAVRLVNAESDGLPGLVVDRYADYLVCQFLSVGAEAWRDTLVQALGELVPAAGIWERSDVDVRLKEGLQPRAAQLAGQAPPELIEIEEHGVRYLVDVRHGHKTGFYLDQRDNRATVAAWARGREVLNCFAYTGSFAVAALRGGATHVTNLEASSGALQIAARHVEINGLAADLASHHEGDVFKVLRQYRDARRSFDLIILDPPKFADSQSQLAGATRGYKDINLLACKLLRPGGVLVTFSCSGVLPTELFQKVVADAALDAGREGRILARLGQAADHPIGLGFPEASYLKGLVVLLA